MDKTPIYNKETQKELDRLKSKVKGLSKEEALSVVDQHIAEMEK